MVCISRTGVVGVEVNASIQSLCRLSRARIDGLESELWTSFDGGLKKTAGSALISEVTDFAEGIDLNTHQVFFCYEDTASDDSDSQRHFERWSGGLVPNNQWRGPSNQDNHWMRAWATRIHTELANNCV